MALRLCTGSLGGMMHRHLVTFLPHSESTIIQPLNQEDRRGVRGGALRMECYGLSGQDVF